MNRSCFARLAVPTGALGVTLLLTAPACHALEAGTAPPTLTCPERPVEGSEVLDAESFHSEQGSLQVDLSFRRSLDSQGRQHYCFVSSHGTESPTLRVRPGDSVVLRLENDGPEQAATDHGLMDKFPQFTGSGASGSPPSCNDYGKGTGVVMGYFDGNTVQAIWNYAQHFAMSDNSYGTMFGPSTVGALNLIAGTTATATLFPLKPNGQPASAAGSIAGGATSGAAIGDPATTRRAALSVAHTTPGLLEMMLSRLWVTTFRTTSRSSTTRARRTRIMCRLPTPGKSGPASRTASTTSTT
jgi:hypothetical protein